MDQQHEIRGGESYMAESGSFDLIEGGSTDDLRSPYSAPSERGPHREQSDWAQDKMIFSYFIERPEATKLVMSMSSKNLMELFGSRMDLGGCSTFFAIDTRQHASGVVELMFVFKDPNAQLVDYEDDLRCKIDSALVKQHANTEGCTSNWQLTRRDLLEDLQDRDGRYIVQAHDLQSSKSKPVSPLPATEEISSSQGDLFPALLLDSNGNRVKVQRLGEDSRLMEWEAPSLKLRNEAERVLLEALKSWAETAIQDPRRLRAEKKSFEDLSEVLNGSPSM